MLARSDDSTQREVRGYACNAQGELDTVTDRVGNTTRFGYVRSLRTGDVGSVIEPHLLASITEADGRVIASQGS